MARHHGVYVCRHCLGCSDVGECDYCNNTGTLNCEACGDVTGFAATVKTNAGEELCGACADLWERDAA